MQEKKLKQRKNDVGVYSMVKGTCNVIPSLQSLPDHFGVLDKMHRSTMTYTQNIILT